MAENPINGIMNSALENLKTMVDVNTIIGNPITSPNGTVVIPVSKVSFGLAAGGSEFGKNQTADSEKPFGGGVGAGVSINPVAFLVANDKQIKLLLMDGQDPISKIIDNVPDMVDKVSALFHKDKPQETVVDFSKTESEE